MSLRATVQNLQKRDETLKAVERNLPAFIEAWQRDIVGVLEIISLSLQPFVDDGTARIERQGITVIEDSLGEYPSERLVITIVGRIIYVVPIARITVGGEGRIDLYRGDRPSESDRIFIVKGRADADQASDIWMIEDRKPEISRVSSGRRSVARGYRNYTRMTGDSIQDAIDVILNIG